MTKKKINLESFFNKETDTFDEEGFLKSLGKIGQEQGRTLTQINESLFEFGDTLSQLDVSTTSIIKNFGGARDRIQEMALGISDASSKLLLLTDQVSSYEGAIALAAKTVNEIADATNRNYVATAEEIQQIVAAQEATGVESDKLVKSFKEQGFSLSLITTNMQKVINTTRALGVNTKAVSDLVVQNLGKLSTFNFANGIEGLTRMSAKAALFNIDMTKIFTLAEDLFDPEKAVDLAASLQRLGVATGDLLDPLKLMDLGQNNPEELMKQVTEMSKRFTYFNEQNQKFEILPGAKRELREIGKVLGLTADELAKMALGSSELADKMSKIRFPTLKTDLTEDQKEMIANLSEMKDGKYMISVERRDDKGEGLGIYDRKEIEKLTDEDLKSLAEQNKDANKTIEETAKDQLNIQKRSLNELESIASSVRGGISMARPVRKGIESLNEFKNDLAAELLKSIDSKKIRELSDVGISDLMNFFKNISSGKFSEKQLEEQGKALDEKYSKILGEEFFDKLEKLYNISKDGITKIGTDLKNSVLVKDNTNSIATASLDETKPESPKEPFAIFDFVEKLRNQRQSAEQTSQAIQIPNTVTNTSSVVNAGNTLNTNLAQTTQNQSTFSNVSQQSDLTANIRTKEETITKLQELVDVSKTGFADLIKTSEKPTKLDISDLTLKDKSVGSKSTENTPLNFAENAKTKNDDKLINTLPFDSTFLRKFDSTLNTALNNTQNTNNNLTEFSNNLNQYSSLKTTDNYSQFSSLVNQNNSQNLLSDPFSSDQKSSKFGLNIPYVTPGLTFNKVDNTKKEDNITTAPVASNLNVKQPIENKRLIGGTDYDFNSLIGILLQNNKPNTTSLTNSENNFKNLSNQITENKDLSTTNITNSSNENLFKEDKSLGNIEIDIDKQMSGFADLFKSFDEKSQNLFNGQIAKKEEDSIKIPKISLGSNNFTPNSLESPLTDDILKNINTQNPITELKSVTNTFDQKIKEYSQSTETKKGEFTHNHTIDFNIKVDAPPGVDTAYITDVMSKVLKQPQTIAALIQEQKNMKNNYNLTGNNVGEYQTTA